MLYGSGGRTSGPNGEQGANPEWLFRERSCELAAFHSSEMRVDNRLISLACNRSAGVRHVLGRFNIFSRGSYGQALPDGKGYGLSRCLQAFFLLQLFRRSETFRMRRETGNIPGVYHFLLGVGNVAGDMLSPLIPAIDNVPRNYYADGYGHRAEFARHVAEIGWFCAILGSIVFLPLLVKDHKFIKKQWPKVVRFRARSCELHAFLCCLLFITGLFLLHMLFDGAGYDIDGDPYTERPFTVRRYDSAAGGAIFAPFYLMFGCAIFLVLMWHSIRRMSFPKKAAQAKASLILRPVARRCHLGMCVMIKSSVIGNPFGQGESALFGAMWLGPPEGADGGLGSGNGGSGDGGHWEWWDDHGRNDNTPHAPE